MCRWQDVNDYSHLSNKHGGWNKRGGGAKFAKSLNLEVGINMEGGILWKKLIHNSNKREVEGGKKSMELKTWRMDFFFVEGGIFRNR